MAKKSTGTTVKARPIGRGKDPLAEGKRLYNPTNSSSATHYSTTKSGKGGSGNADREAERHNRELAKTSNTINA